MRKRKGSMRKVYADAYRVTRLSENHANVTANGMYLSLDALHSRNAINNEFTGWYDDLRRNTFLILRNVRYPLLANELGEDEIPF